MRRVLILCFGVACCMAFLSSEVTGQSLLDQCMKEYQEEDYEEALRCFLDASSSGTESPRVACYIGLIYKMMENYTAAIPYLRKASTLSPELMRRLLPSSMFYTVQVT